MIELILALLLATCERGTRIPDWTAYVHDNPQLVLIASVRFADDNGVRWLYMFGGGVLFLTRLDTEHGACARQLADSDVLDIFGEMNYCVHISKHRSSENVESDSQPDNQFANTPNVSTRGCD